MRTLLYGDLKTMVACQVATSLPGQCGCNGMAMHEEPVVWRLVTKQTPKTPSRPQRTIKYDHDGTGNVDSKNLNLRHPDMIINCAGNN
jgi:hypothetical protein